MSEPQYKSSDFYTTLRLRVANASQIKGPQRLSSSAREYIGEAMLRHAEHLQLEAELIAKSGATAEWDDDCTVTVIHKNGTDEEFLDVTPKTEPTQWSKDTDFIYKNAFSTHTSVGSEKVFLFEEPDTQAEYVKSLPVIRIGGSGLLSVNIPTDRVDVTNPATGVSKPWDLSKHPVIKKNNQAYRIVHAMHEDEMLMYYHPVTKWVYEVSGC